MPVVVVEIAPSPPPALARALLDACSAAVREGRCDLATDEPAAKSVAVAIVRWDTPAERHARVQVGVRRDREPEWRTRSLDFKQTDARVERWRTVGLTIATLAGELVPEPAAKPDTGATKPEASGTKPGANETKPEVSGAKPQGPAAVAKDSAGTASTTVTAGSGESSDDRESSTAPEPQQQPARSAPDATREGERRAEREPAEDREADARADDARADDARADDARREPHGRTEPASLWAGASAMAGPGLDDGPWRIGGWIDVGWRPTSAPLFARATVGFAARPGGGDPLSVQWETATLGGGVVIGGRAIALEPRVAAGIAGLRVRVKDDTTLRQDSGSQWQATLNGGADLVWLASSVGFVASVDAWKAPATTQILLANRAVASDLAAGWALGLGARVVLE